MEYQNNTSQFGQDLWIAKVNQFKKDGYFVDIGAYDGKTISNTYFLEKELQWKGILVEPNPYEFIKLLMNRLNYCEMSCILPEEGIVELILNGWMSAANLEMTDERIRQTIITNQTTKVKGITLLQLLEKYEAPNNIDAISIDIEGGEYAILQAFFNSGGGEKYKFNCAVIEHNSVLGGEFRTKQELIRKLMVQNGYRLAENQPNDEIDDFFILHKETINEIQLNSPIIMET